VCGAYFGRINEDVNRTVVFFSIKLVKQEIKIALSQLRLKDFFWKLVFTNNILRFFFVQNVQLN